MDDMQKLMDMDHLKATDDDMKAAVDLTVAQPKPAGADPKTAREYTFQFSYTDGRGKVWQGQFTSKILTLAEQSQAGLLRARLAGGVAYEALDDYTRELNFMLSQLAFALKEKPEWAKDLRSLDDYALLQALYEEVATHESTFRGRR